MSTSIREHFTITPLQEADTRAVLGIGRRLWDDPIVRQNLPQELGDALRSNAWRKPRFWVARGYYEIIGFAGLCQSGINYHVFEFTWCNVLPEYQGKGVGRALVERRIEAARDAGGKVIILTTMKPEVYLRYGFKVLSEHQLWGKMPTSLMLMEI
jgi:GNAT superfamily N-acetyltransferase